MPARDLVDPSFDGHLERPLLDLSPQERLDWIWTCMQVLRWARAARAIKTTPAPLDEPATDR